MGKSMPPVKRRRQSPWIPILASLASDLGLVMVIAMILLTVYLLDTITPLGEPIWLLYCIPLVLSYWSDRYYAIPTVCLVTLLFLLAGFSFSPQGIAVSHAVIYRFTFFLVFIIFALILWTIRRRRIMNENLI